ncbi:MAG: hypothetical protein KKC05_03025 [Nanoarchaeota archaeon]|nr:hypothetical protein [Nanoarchaeota archaeon]
MKYIIILCFLLLAVPVHAAMVGVNIAEKIDGNMKTMINAENNVMKTTVDLQNTGSITYNSRARLDIFDGERIIFTGWSKENVVKPGSFKDYPLFWIKNDGNLSARLRVYYGEEIKEKMIEIPQLDDITSEDVFEISNVRTYDDRITLFIRSKENVDNMIIIPNNYPLSWIVEQNDVGRINANEFKQVTIGYSTPEYSQININLITVSEDGRYQSAHEVLLQRESGISFYVNPFFDWVSISFRSVFG